MPKVRTAILISGRGSNMVSLIEAAKAKDYPASINLVISNRPEAAGLEKASRFGIRAICIDHKAYNSRQDFEKALHKELKSSEIDLVCCAGFMRVLTKEFTRHWEGRMLNIHPSLLPKYKGLNTHARALEAGDQEHGCSVHFVSEELDGGKVVGQARVKIGARDDVQSLTEKVLAKELKLYPDILRQVAISLQKP